MPFRQPSEFISALSIRLDGQEPIFIISAQVALRGAGTHLVYPYYSGATWSRFSAEKISPGSFSFSGLLLSPVAQLKELLYDNWQQFQSPVTFVMGDVESGIDLINGAFYQFRINDITTKAASFGNVSVMRGSFSATFQSFVPTDV